jgi:hypothetical protein
VGVAKIVFGPRRPLGDPQLLELRQVEAAQIPGRDHVGKEQADHLAPHDVLAAEPDIHVAGGKVEVGFTQVELVLLVATHRVRVEARIDGEYRIGVGAAGDLPLHPWLPPWAVSSARARAIDQCSGRA